MSQKQVVTRPGGTMKWARDAATNDSDKTFTVPTGKMWALIYVVGELTCTATVGGRALQIHVTYDGTNFAWKSGGTALTASQSGNNVLVCNNGSGSNTTAVSRITAAAINASTMAEAPTMYLPAGATIRVWDTAAIDAAADDLTVVLHYIEYEA